MKKIIYIILIIIILIGIIYWNANQNQYEEIDLNTIIISKEEEKKEREEETIVIHITGAIKNPGIIKLEKNSRIADAIGRAGGLTEEANIEKINLAYQIGDGQKIYIPSIYDKEEVELITMEAGEGVIERNTGNELININTATQTELETLPGVGPSTALKIIKYRKEKGRYKAIEEIKNVEGIGEAKYQKIKDYICVD